MVEASPTPGTVEAMTNTRYGHSNVGGGDQDQGERKDAGWERRQGGPQSRREGSQGEPRHKADRGHGSAPPPGTNTQGELAGIGEAAERSEAGLTSGSSAATEAGTGARGRDLRGAGTDQPRRMGGPLGGDHDDPHLPEGAQNADTRGTGAGGFDRGVDAKNVGAVHQGVREEDPAAGS
jgi:hypothetical protein